MSGAIPALPQYAFMAWCLVKAQCQSYVIENVPLYEVGRRWWIMNRYSFVWRRYWHTLKCGLIPVRETEENQERCLWR